MKKIAAVLMVLTLALAMMPTGALAGTEDDPDIYELYAGQDIDVGEVQVWNDFDTLYVKYVVDEPGWCMTETHLDVQTSVDLFPVNKKGNPQPGLFDYKTEHDPCVTEYTYEVPLPDTWAVGDSLFIAAHAALQKAASIVVYGSQLSGDVQDTGDIYAIDLSSETADLLHEYTGLVNAPNYPNGNAYDPDNDRVYFAAPDGTLRFYDLGHAQEYTAGYFATSGNVASGAWYDGTYYYIPQGTDDLRAVTVTGNTTDGFSTNDVKVCDYSGNNKSFDFGDIVFDSTGLLLGSANAGGYEYFTIDISDGTCAYTKQHDILKHKQLAFSGGTLYAHDAAAPGNFYEVDPSTWNETLLGPVSGEAEGFTGQYTDLASGPTDYQTETAWGEGERFVEKGNWATYFTYSLQAACPDIIGLATTKKTADGGILEFLSTRPSDVSFDGDTSENVVVFQEFVGSLESDLPLDIGDSSVSAGTPFCSYYVNFNDGDLDDGEYLEGSITFEAAPYGLAVLGGTVGGGYTLFDIDELLQSSTGLTYPGRSGLYAEAERGIENSNETDDVGLEDGEILMQPIRIGPAFDSFRIILPAEPLS